MRSPRWGILGVVLACGGASPAAAQSLAIQGLAAHSTHALVGNLLGGEVVFSIPLHADAVTLQAGVARLGGTSTEFTSTCHGFIVQDHCEPESVSGDARLTDGSLALGVRVWRRSFAALRVLGGVRLAQVHASWQGQSTGRAFSGDRTWWGTEIGLEGTLSPWRALPLALQVSGGLMRFQPFQSYRIADAYLPLDESSSLATVRLGVVWRHGR